MDTADFKNAQRNFYKWASKWSATGQTEDYIKPDILEIVSLLQVLGFKVRFFDFSDTSDIACLKDSSKGISIMVRCGHSGARSVLEYSGECRCPNFSEAKIWQVSGSQPKSIAEEIKDTGTDLLAEATVGQRLVISQVINHIFQILLSKGVDQNENRTPVYSAKLSEKNIRNSSSRSQSSLVKIKNEKPNTFLNLNTMIQYSSPNKVLSPTRYRSLDTLTGGTHEEVFSEPRMLKQSPPYETNQYPLNVSYSSPNLSIPVRQSTETSSPLKGIDISTSLCEILKELSDGRDKIINVHNILMELCTNVKRTSTPFEELFSFKETKESLLPKKLFSNPSTVPNNQPKKTFSSSPNLNKTTIIQKPGIIKGRPPIRSSSTSILSTGLQKDVSAVRNNVLNRKLKATSVKDGSFDRSKLAGSSLTAQKTIPILSRKPMFGVKGSTPKYS